jgi:hypothetical protein
MKSKEVKIWSLPIDKDNPYLDITEYVRFKSERSWYATINRQHGFYNLRLDIFDSKVVMALYMGDL